MDGIEIPELTLGKHVKLEDAWWLPVRFADASTFFEEPKSGSTFIEEERFWELRNANNEVRFIIISSKRHAALRDAGPCKGIAPYFWKGGPGSGEANS